MVKINNQAGIDRVLDAYSAFADALNVERSAREGADARYSDLVCGVTREVDAGATRKDLAAAMRERAVALGDAVIGYSYTVASSVGYLYVAGQVCSLPVGDSEVSPREVQKATRAAFDLLGAVPLGRVIRRCITTQADALERIAVAVSDRQEEIAEEVAKAEKVAAKVAKDAAKVAKDAPVAGETVAPVAGETVAGETVETVAGETVAPEVAPVETVETVAPVEPSGPSIGDLLRVIAERIGSGEDVTDSDVEALRALVEMVEAARMVVAAA